MKPLLTNQEDRRRRRSVDPLIALHYQLSHARTRDELDTIVVADASGVVVAGAGSWAACEELAAYAPILARPRSETEGAMLAGTDESRVEALRREVAITSIELDDQEVLICVRGGEAPTASLKEAVFGVTRILKAAA
jgi:hypothetical protein